MEVPIEVAATWVSQIYGWDQGSPRRCEACGMPTQNPSSECGTLCRCCEALLDVVGTRPYWVRTQIEWERERQER